MFPAPEKSLAEAYSCKRGYIEGNVAEMMVLFCISQNESDTENILKLLRT
jgi:hypothetical protein